MDGPVEETSRSRMKNFAKSIKRPKLKVLNKTSNNPNIDLILEHPELSRSYF